MKETVKIYTNYFNSDHTGDFVKCTDCGSLMLIHIGEEKCRECGSKNLQWADENHQECDIETLEKLNYTISYKEK